jgi:Tfp pilus assembly protein PilO
MTEPELPSGTKALLLIAVVVCVVFAFYRFVFVPFTGAAAAVDRDILAAERRLVDNRRKVHLASAVSGEYRKYESLLREAVPGETRMVALANEVEVMARSAGVVLLDIKPLPEKNGSLSMEYVLEVNVRGPMTALAAFLEQLGAGERLLCVTRLLIRPYGRNSSDVQANIQVTGLLLKP